MKLTLKKTMPALALGAVTLLATACGGNAMSGSTTNGTDLKATVTFFSNIWTGESTAEMDMMNDIIKEFNKTYPNIKVEVKESGRYWEIDEKIKGLLKTPDQLPSMAVCFPDYVVSYLDTGYVLDMVPFMNDELIGLGKKPGAKLDETVEDNDTKYEDLNKTFLKEGQNYLEEGTYSLPWYKNSEALYYNDSVLKAADPNYDVTNREGVINVARKLVVNKNLVTKHSVWNNNLKKPEPKDVKIEWKKGVVTPIGFDSSDNLYITFSEMLGVPYTSNVDTNKDGKLGKGEAVKFYNAETKKANPKAVKMVKMLKGWYEEGLITTEKSAARVSGKDEGKLWNRYRYDQELMMYVNGTKNAWYGVPAAFDNVEIFNSKVGSCPVIDDGMLETTATVKDKNAKAKVMSQGANLVFFDKGKEENEATWLFYKFLTNKENSGIVGKQMTSMPIRSSSYESTAIKGITSTTATTGFDRVQKDMYNLYEDYSNNGQTFISPVSSFSSTARIAVKNLIENVFATDKIGADLDKFIEDQFKTAYEAC